MEVTKDYMCSDGSDAAIILMLGSGGSNILTKGVSKWLVKQGVKVLSLGPDKEEAGYHSFPLERVEAAIEFLKGQGNRRLGVLGASITTIPALTAAARFSDITLTIAVSPLRLCFAGLCTGKAGWLQGVADRRRIYAHMGGKAYSLCELCLSASRLLAHGAGGDKGFR